MTIHQCMWIQWSILQITTYIYILHTYYVHTTYILRTYYVQNEWSHSLLLNSVQARQKVKLTINNSKIQFMFFDVPLAEDEIWDETKWQSENSKETNTEAHDEGSRSVRWSKALETHTKGCLQIAEADCNSKRVKKKQKHLCTSVSFTRYTQLFFESDESEVRLIIMWNMFLWWFYTEITIPKSKQWSVGKIPLKWYK